jgi:hypothetical protein
MSLDIEQFSLLIQKGAHGFVDIEHSAPRSKDIQFLEISPKGRNLVSRSSGLSHILPGSPIQSTFCAERVKNSLRIPETHRRRRAATRLLFLEERVDLVGKDALGGSERF